MSHANPTPLRLGQRGTLGGRNYSIAGRVVLNVEIEGETYYWNEFNLVNDSGQNATLVFEEGEHGPEWRLFTLFEPPHPMTAGEAATKRVGDTVNLTGYPAKVTLVDESRVNFIEGRAPEGVEVGDVANYFNLEAGNQMWVVSWTGGEVECFKGMDLPAGQVAKAFGMMPAALGAGATPLRLGSIPLNYGMSGGPSKAGLGKFLSTLVALGLIAVFGFVLYQNFLRGRASPVVKPSAPPPVATTGAVGRHRGESCRVAGVATMEMRTVTSAHDSHEYRVTVGSEKLLLTHRLNPRSDSWHLLRPVVADPQLDAFRAAALRIGERVQLDGTEARVSSLFLAKLVSGSGTLPPEYGVAPEFFGFRAASGTNEFLARWSSSSLEFFRTAPLAKTTAHEMLGLTR